VRCTGNREVNTEEARRRRRKRRRSRAGE